jgi:hypothetical protein
LTKKIELNDTDPLVSLVPPAGTTYVEQTASVLFTVELSAKTDEDITIPITYGGTAKQGPDFDAPLSVTILAGSKSRSFNVSLIDDSLTEESTETIVVTLGAPSAGILSTPKNSTLSITDNDSPPTVYWKDRYYSADEASGSMTLHIGLTKVAAEAVTVNLEHTSTGRTVTRQVRQLWPPEINRVTKAMRSERRTVATIRRRLLR